MRGKTKPTSEIKLILTCIGLIILTFTFLSFAPKLNASKIYDNSGRLIADNSYKISAEQLKIFTKYEDLILNCFLENLKYPAIAHDFILEDKFILSFSIVERTGKIFDLKTIKPENTNGKVFKVFSDELERVTNVCYPDRIKSQKEAQIYYLPFSFKLIPRENQEEKLAVQNGYIFLQIRKKQTYEYSTYCPLGKPIGDTISTIPPQIPKAPDTKK